MKTAYGRLALFAFLILTVFSFFLPMRAGTEDDMILSPAVLKMSVGGSYTLSCAVATDRPGQRISYTSSDDHVASVSPSGTVFALSSGEAVITASASGGSSASMTVEVDGTPLSYLRLNTGRLEINKGQYSSLCAEYNTDASDTRLYWQTADENIARVSPAGRIFGAGGGETTVTAVSPSGLTASAKVFVHCSSTAVHMSPDNLTVGVGAKVKLKASFLPEDSTDKVKRFSSSDRSVVTADDDNVLHALSVGSAYVTVYTEDGRSAVMEVHVERAPKKLQLEPKQATLERNDTLDMQLSFLNAAGSEEKDMSHLIVWTSSDPSVAAVDENGSVTALKSGETLITAEADGITQSSLISVEVTVHEILLEENEIYLLREETASPIKLSYVLSPIDADNKTVHFESDNPMVASVDGNGVITLTGGYGTAVITLRAASGAEAYYTVNVVTQMPSEEAPEETEFRYDNEMSSPAYEPEESGFGDAPIGSFGDDDANEVIDTGIDFDMYA